MSDHGTYPPALQERLQRIPAKYRGVVVNEFLNAVRTYSEYLPIDWIKECDAHTLNHLIGVTHRKLRRNIDNAARYDNPDSRDAYTIALNLFFGEHQMWGYEFMKWAISYALMSPEELAELKESKKTAGKNEAPTDKQLSYLKYLGCHLKPQTKGEASALISELKGSQNG